MKTRNVLAIAALFIALSGCSAIMDVNTIASTHKAGVLISDSQMAGFVDKKNTQQDVIAQLGQPHEKSMLGAKEVWKYAYSELNMMKGVKINDVCVFEFDSTGLILAHYKTALGSTSK